MSAFMSAKDSIAAILSAKTGLTLTASQLYFSTPLAVDKQTFGGNTKIKVTGLAGAPVKGSAIVYYDRLNLADFANFQYTPIATPPGSTLYENLDEIRQMTGMILTQDDVNDAVVINGGGSESTLTVAAKANSLGWIGSVDLTFLQYPHISTVFSSNYLAGF